MSDTEHKGYAENRMPIMAYTAQAKGLFSIIRDKGCEVLTEKMQRTYLNEATMARAERIFDVADRTGVSPTAVSLAYLLYDKEIKSYPIIGTSRPERIAEALEVFSLDQSEIDKLFA